MSEIDLLNTLDFFARVFEAQEDDKMQRLKVDCFGSAKSDDLKDEDKRFINAIVNAGLTKLWGLSFRRSASYWGHAEAQSHLLGFLQD